MDDIIMNKYKGNGSVKDIAGDVRKEVAKLAGNPVLITLTRLKSPMVLLASISVIFGIMMGVLGTAWVLMQTTAEFARNGAVANTEAGIVTKEVLLEHLRSGRYKDATRQIETSLDNDLAGAMIFARDGVEFSQNTLKAIEIERKARGISGYEPHNATVTVAVEEMFRLVPRPELSAHDTTLTLEDDSRLMLNR